MSPITASHASGLVHATNESLQVIEEPHADESHPPGSGEPPATPQAKLSWGGVVAQLYALELERRGVKLNLEQTAAKMGVEMPPKDCTAK